MLDRRRKGRRGFEEVRREAGRPSLPFGRSLGEGCDCEDPIAVLVSDRLFEVISYYSLDDELY